LSPADIPKHGGRFDLPIALGILLASRQIKLDPKYRCRISTLEFYGELGLNGELRSVPGMFLAAAHAAPAAPPINGPQGNSDEVRVLLRRSAGIGFGAGLPDMGVGNMMALDAGTVVSPVIRAARHLLAVCGHLDGSTPLPALTPSVVPSGPLVSDASL